jgi:hypothetical protein
MNKNCSADVHAAVSYADELLTQGSEKDITLLKHAFFLTNNASRRAIFAMINVPNSKLAQDLDEWNCASILATAFHSFPVFQMTGSHSLDKFCTQLETWKPSYADKFTLSSPITVLKDNPFDGTPSPNGIAASYDSKTAFYAFLAASIHRAQDDAKLAPRRILSPLDSASWTWL